MRYVLSPDAEQDLTDIRDYIAAGNIIAADCWIEKLFAAFETLAQYPNLGHKARGPDESTRFILARRILSDHLPGWPHIAASNRSYTGIAEYTRLPQPTVFLNATSPLAVTAIPAAAGANSRWCSMAAWLATCVARYGGKCPPGAATLQ